MEVHEEMKDISAVVFLVLNLHSQISVFAGFFFFYTSECQIIKYLSKCFICAT